MSAVSSDYGVLILNIVFYIEFTPSVVILWHIMHIRLQHSPAQPSARARKDMEDMSDHKENNEEGNCRS